MTTPLQGGPDFPARMHWWLAGLVAAALLLWLLIAVWPDWLNAVLISKKTLVSAVLNGITLAGLYFLVASGFTLVFGLMRNVNLAHGSLYLLGAYLGYEAMEATGSWLLGVLGGTLALAGVGALMQVLVFRRLEGDELRQALVAIGLSIVAADLMLWIWTGRTYQLLTPGWLDGSVTLPIVSAIRSNGEAVFIKYPLYRLVVLGAAIVIGAALMLVLARTRLGMLIRAGVDDRAMLQATGVNVHVLFAVVFAVGAAMAGFAGVVGGSALSVAPGEDARYLLASLVVVIVGGMGSIPGAAIGALLIGLAEQIGLVYFPTYGMVLTFLIMVLALAIRPQGILGRRRPPATPPVRNAEIDETPAAPACAPAGLIERIGPLHLLALLLLVLYPLVASDFFLFQIGAYSLIVGLVALSLMLLAGYGGMVSLAQISLAGLAGYVVAILGTNSIDLHGYGWPWWLLVPLAAAIAALASALVGWIAARTEGIYTIMITLAIAVAFFYLAQQNYSLFNGHSGFAGVLPPDVLGVNWRAPVPFYYLCLAIAALSYAAILYVSRAPFGLALQAIRDNPRRMAALGYAVNGHKVAAWAMAGGIAGLGGVLLVWFNGRISPGTIGVEAAIDVLVVAVIGGLRHPVGPFLGALAFVLMRTFAIDIMGAERFNTLIGLVFLAIVYFSPDGLLGLFARLRAGLAATGLGPPPRVPEKTA
ncbi:MAG TPA: ABC transporter permease [Paracoccaceae bacterium]|nr:ABC transporter permease [Paracoccaceae bacterium]